MKTVKYISCAVLALLGLVSCKGNLEPDNPNSDKKASLPKGISLSIKPGSDNGALMHYTDATLSGSLVLLGNPELLPNDYSGNLSAVVAYGTDPEELSGNVTCSLGDPVTDYWTVTVPYTAQLSGLEEGTVYYFSIYGFYGSEKPVKSDLVKFFTFSKGPVDLDLTSGRLWASANLGGEFPEDSGDYYAWAETETKSQFDWGTYSWCVWKSEIFALTKYCNYNIWGWEGFTDDKLSVESSDDAATVKLGAGWSTPTVADWEELDSECEWKAATINGLDGWLVRSKVDPENNGKVIFLPCTGHRYEGEMRDEGTVGAYWTSDVHKSSCFQANSFQFTTSERAINSTTSRFRGLVIRPVKSK